MIRTTLLSRSIGAALLLVAFACAPDEDPFRTRIPPRDPDGAALRTTTVGADSLQTVNMRHTPDFSRADRVLFGSWEGVTATAFLRYDRKAFIAFDGDTLAGSTVFGSELSFNCVEGHGAETGIDVTIQGVSAGAANEWTEGTLVYPGPATDATPATVTTVDNCTLDDDFPEKTYAIPDAVIEAWLADSTSNNGIALRSNAGAIFQFASAENNIVNVDSGMVVTLSGARLRFRAIRPSGDTTAVFLSESQLIGDHYVLSPDSAATPCADSTDCLKLGRGLVDRILVNPILPALPSGSNVHRAVLRLHVLGHPRFDRDLELLVFRLTSTFPAGAPVDSLVTTSGTIWHREDLPMTATTVDVPLTELVQAWYDDVFPRRGFLIREANEDRGVAEVAFASATHPDPALRPTLVIDYTVPLGGRP